MPEYKKCTGLFKRQGLDSGTGRIFVPSSYGGGDNRYSNDNCGEVTKSDCPTGYKLLTNINTPSYHHINDDKKISNENMKKWACWNGGHYNGSYGAQAVWGMNHGVTPKWVTNSFDSGWADEDNYGKPCFKSDWRYTNPENGNKTRKLYEKEHIDTCCGFNDNKRSKLSNQDKYCHPHYCFETGSEYDKISLKCNETLLKRCKNWGLKKTSIGFEDDRCSNPLSQIANTYNLRIQDLNSTHLSDKKKITASIPKSEYAKIGSMLCKKEDFKNINKSGNEKLKHDKCIKWCKNNSEKCQSIIKGTCKEIYDRAKSNPESNDIKDYEKICACNWPEEFYRKIEDYYKNTFKVKSVNTNRKCLYKSCNSSHIPYKGDTKNSCPNTTFVSCVQNLEIDFRGSQIQGTVNVGSGQEQKCGSLADTGVQDSKNPQTNSSSSSSSSSNNNNNNIKKSPLKEEEKGEMFTFKQKRIIYAIFLTCLIVTLYLAFY